MLFLPDKDVKFLIYKDLCQPFGKFRSEVQNPEEMDLVEGSTGSDLRCVGGNPRRQSRACELDTWRGAGKEKTAINKALRRKRFGGMGLHAGYLAAGPGHGKQAAKVKKTRPMPDYSAWAPHLFHGCKLKINHYHGHCTPTGQRSVQP